MTTNCFRTTYVFPSNYISKHSQMLTSIFKPFVKENFLTHYNLRFICILHIKLEHFILMQWHTDPGKITLSHF